MMKPYKNISGKSGVTAFEEREESILVEFNHGKIYKYSSSSAGKGHVERMKALAAEGKGLSTYISRHVRGRYEEIIK